MNTRIQRICSLEHANSANLFIGHANSANLFIGRKKFYTQKNTSFAPMSIVKNIPSTAPMSIAKNIPSTGICNYDQIKQILSESSKVSMNPDFCKL